MSDAVTIEVVRSLSVIPGALAASLAAWFAYRASAHAKDNAETSARIEKNTDGMTEKLVSLTARSSHAEGVLDEHERVKTETNPA